MKQLFFFFGGGCPKLHLFLGLIMDFQEEQNMLSVLFQFGCISRADNWLPSSPGRPLGCLPPLSLEHSAYIQTHVHTLSHYTGGAA